VVEGCESSVRKTINKRGCCLVGVSFYFWKNWCKQESITDPMRRDLSSLDVFSFQRGILRGFCSCSVCCLCVCGV